MTWIVTFILSSILLLLMSGLYLLVRHLNYQYSCDKVMGTYGEYAYWKGTYGSGYYKLYFSRKENILGVKLWGEAVQFGGIYTQTYCDECLTPDSFKDWVETSLRDYERHLKNWGKV